MGVDLTVMFATAITADEAFMLPERLNSASAVVAACRDYYEQMKPSVPGLEAGSWRWGELWPAVTAPSTIVEAWESPYLGIMLLTGMPGILWIQPNQIQFNPGEKLSGFAADDRGCQTPTRQVCRAIARFFNGLIR